MKKEVVWLFKLQMRENRQARMILFTWKNPPRFVIVMIP